MHILYIHSMYKLFIYKYSFLLIYICTFMYLISPSVSQTRLKNSYDDDGVYQEGKISPDSLENMH